MGDQSPTYVKLPRGFKVPSSTSIILSKIYPASTPPVLKVWDSYISRFWLVDVPKSVYSEYSVTP